MTQSTPQVPWTDEQWARVNQVIQEEAQRARVAATFLPLIGPLPGDTDFVRREVISYPPLPAAQQPPPARIAIDDRNIWQLATLQVRVPVRGAQMADPEMTSVLALFRRAANVLARLEDTVVFRGLLANPNPPPQVIPGAANLPPLIWEILGGEASNGLWPLPPAPQGPPYPPAPPNPRWIPVSAAGQPLVTAVSGAIGALERNGHFGPFAVVLDQNLFLIAQTPDQGSLVSPQDRIIPFLGGGPLLRSSTLPDFSGVVVALGGAPVELVVARDVSLAFLQVTEEPNFLFRIFEKMRLRIKEAEAIMLLFVPAPTVTRVAPNAGPVAGSTSANPMNIVITGTNFMGATSVAFDGAVAPSFTINSDTQITVPLPASSSGAIQVHVLVTTPGGTNAATTAAAFTYQAAGGRHRNG
jgi:uncharacterized linocin/CFP29 family protein